MICSPFRRPALRYNIFSSPDKDGTAITALNHRYHPLYGFPFHPEHHTDEQFGDEIYLTLRPKRIGIILLYCPHD